MRIRLGLRATLLLALLPVLLLPWAGLNFVGTMAELTRDDRRQALAGTARSFAAVLHERPDLFDKSGSDLADDASPIVAWRLDSVRVDGRDREWNGVQATALPVTVFDRAPQSTLRVTIALARSADWDQGHTGASSTSLLVKAHDERYVPRQESTGSGRARPGDTVKLLVGNSVDAIHPVRMQRIVETRSGWLIEQALPPDARFIRVQVDDVDYQGNRKIEATADSGLLIIVGEPGQADSFEAQIADRRERLWNEALSGFVRTNIRVAAYNRQGRLLALRGDFVQSAAQSDGWLSALGRRLLSWAVRTGARFDRRDEAGSVQASIGSALRGLPAGTSARQTGPDGNPFWVISQAHPVWLKDKVAGALLIEQGSSSDLATGQSALEWLAVLTAIAVGATLIGLFGLASLLVSRILRLRDAAELAIDSRGRVVGAMPRFRLRDELSELAGSYDQVLTRLHEHQHYLANLRSRLVHELRTPIMVVRSSLENLIDSQNGKQESTTTFQAYVSRALGGATRLERLVSSMSEAASLESMLESSQLEQVDLVELIAGLTASYDQIYPDPDVSPRYEMQCDLTEAPAKVVPETIAQALDKLAANAADFAEPASTIRVQLQAADGFYEMAMVNHGPALPDVMAESLFESMVSVRAQAAREQSHLGLGLYLVRLIAEFHGGAAFANNVTGGVRIGFTIESGLNGD